MHASFCMFFLITISFVSYFIISVPKCFYFSVLRSDSCSAAAVLCPSLIWCYFGTLLFITPYYYCYEYNVVLLLYILCITIWKNGRTVQTLFGKIVLTKFLQFFHEQRSCLSKLFRRENFYFYFTVTIVTTTVQCIIMNFVLIH